LVDTYIALTRFQAERLIAGGLPAEKFRIKPNFVPDVAPSDVVPFAAREPRYALYVGHLSAHKGVRTLLKAWRQLLNLPLKVVGSGPLLEELVAYTEAHGLDVEFTGLLPRSEVLGLVRRAAVQVVPSEWYEGFPLVIAEAQYCGTPVVASRIGGLPELVVEGSMGALFEPGNAMDLAKAVGSVVAGLEGVTSRVQPLPRVTHSAMDSFQALKSIYAALTQPRSDAVS
jgi:glycosyltransferase involved in cell wall biosynthesis